VKENIEKQGYLERSHILVIDDDDRISTLVSRYLMEHDYVVTTAQDTLEARDILSKLSFDALVVDIMMPGEDGLSFTSSLRDAGDNTPILLLTALGEAQDRIKGLETGADDYLPKPFEPRELILRLQAILKRTNKAIKDIVTFKIGEWVFDPSHNELSNKSSTQRLTTVEANLLNALAQNAGRVVSREELASLCSIDGGDRTIDVQVTRLRRKIEEDSKNPRFLQTVRGKGYLLRAEDL
jgi:two-component system phosphate regulon response regulator OmpR